MPKPSVGEPTAALARLKRAQIVRSLFPEADIDMPDSMPGRSWIAWHPPPKTTALDDVVTELIARAAAPRILSPAELTERGIACPYYAVRAYAVLSLLKAGIDHKAYDASGAGARVVKLTNQKNDLEARLRNSRKIIKHYSHIDAMQIGNPYWLPVEEFEIQRLEVEKAGRAFFDGTVSDIRATEKYLEFINLELERISPKKRMPETWRTSFVRTMGGLYCTLTGSKSPPDDGTFFNDMLTKATYVVGGEAATVSDWGQTRTLIKRFKDAPAGTGFDEGASGGFSLNSIERVQERGPEVRHLVEIAEGIYAPQLGEIKALKLVMDQIDKAEPGTDRLVSVALELYGNLNNSQDDRVRAALFMMLLNLRDRDDAPEHIILREVVMKPELTRADLNSRALLVQLGWQVDQRHEIGPALLKLIAAARAGDAKAVAALVLAQDADEPAANAVLGPARISPFSYVALEEVMYRLHPRPKTDELTHVLWGLLYFTIEGCAEADEVARLRLEKEEPEAFAEQEARGKKSEEERIAFIFRKARPTPMDIMRRYPKYPKDI